MGIVKKHSLTIDRQFGASNLHSDVPDIINHPSLACSTPRARVDVPVPSVKRKGSIKSFIRRSLPSGGQSRRTRLPSPHWRHRFSLPTTVLNSMTDPELQVNLLPRSCSYMALSLTLSELDVAQVRTRQSRSRRRNMPHASSDSQADLLRRRCLKGEAFCDKPYSIHKLSSTCPDLPLLEHTSLFVEPLEDDEDPEEERHPLEEIWTDDLSYHRFDDDLDEEDISYFTFNDNLYAGVDL